MSKHLQKLFALVLVCCGLLGSSSAWAQLLQYEPFSYDINSNLGGQGTWVNVNTGDEVTINSGNLSYSNLKASTGNLVTFSGAGIDPQLVLTNPISFGLVYYSFIFQVTDLSGVGPGETNATYFAGLGGSTTTFGSTLWIRKAGEGFNIGFSKRSSGSDIVWQSDEYNVDQNIFIVGAYNIVAGTANDFAKVWINPASTSLGGDEPTASIETTLTGSDLNAIDRFFLRQDNNTKTPNINFDELRVGTTWASVTPSEAPTTNPTLTPSTGSINLGEKLVGATAEGKYTLSAENIAAGENIVLTTSGPFKISTSETGPFTTTLTLTAAELATKIIRVNAIPETVGEITGEIIHSTAGATDAKVGLVVYGASPFVQDFNRCIDGLPGGWMQYSVSGSVTWGCTTFGQQGNGVQMSGFTSGAAQVNEDWLISPKLDLSDYTFPILKINYRTQYAGEALTIMASTNYSGSGNPMLASWSVVTSLPADEANEWMLLNNVGLENYKSAGTYIAFVYTSNADGATRWTLDNFEIRNETRYVTATDASYNFGIVAENDYLNADASTFTFSAVGFTEDVVITSASEHFELSKDNITFSEGTITFSAEEAAQENTVWVRFLPKATSVYFEDQIVLSSGEFEKVLGKVTGSSIMKAKTLDVVTWNMEWFGSESNGPSDEELQYENAKKVITDLGADIIALQEVSSETKIRQLATETGYEYITKPVTGQQQIGFLYKPEVVTVKKDKVLLSKLYSDIKAGTKTLQDYPNNNSSLLWASGRLPYLVQFEATIDGVKQTFDVVNLHAKANSATAELDYARRFYDAQVLRDTLAAQYGNANLIVLGDYNDDVDVSVVNGQLPSFAPIVSNPDYITLTYNLSLTGAATYESGSFVSFLDHIVISTELEDEYIENSIMIENKFLTSIPNFRTNTSDHLPVSARFYLSATSEVSFSQATITKAEDAGKFNVTLSLTNAATTDQTVTISVANGATASASDYTITGATDGAVTVTVPANNTSATFEVTIVDDTEVEETEQVVFNISSVSAGLTIGSANNFTLVITDNDTPTGIADGTKGQFQLYPNPVNGGAVRMLLPERIAAQAKVNMVVYSMEGRKVLSVTGTQDAVQQQLNSKLASMPNGMYMVLIEAGKEFFQAKMIK